MGQVNLSLEEYDNLKKQADIAAQARECFVISRSYNSDVTLKISVGKAAELFKSLFNGSIYDDGSYEIEVDENNLDYETEVASYYVKAVKKEEPEEDREDEE